MVLYDNILLIFPAGVEEAVAAEGEVQAEVETDPAQVALVLVKRQAPELTADCMVYRYGSLATSVDVVRESIKCLYDSTLNLNQLVCFYKNGMI